MYILYIEPISIFVYFSDEYLFEGLCNRSVEPFQGSLTQREMYIDLNYVENGIDKLDDLYTKCFDIVLKEFYQFLVIDLKDSKFWNVFPTVYCINSVTNFGKYWNLYWGLLKSFWDTMIVLTHYQTTKF